MVKKLRVFSSFLTISMVLFIGIIPVSTDAANRAGFNAEMLTLTPGRTTSEIGVTWHSAAASGRNGAVKFAPRSAMVRNNFPDSAVIVKAVSADAYTNRISHKATLTGLIPNTEYVYAVSNDGVIYSRQYTYRTPAAGAFTFVAVGDPHLTDRSVSERDYLETNKKRRTLQGWQETLNAISRAIPNVGFIASMGDQVDRNLDDGRPEDKLDEHQPKYANLFRPDILRRLPLAPAIGNHEARSNYSFSFHYNLPNERIITGNNMVVTSSSERRHISKRENENRGHYYFLYNNALFVVLNSSARVSDIRQARAKVAIFDDVLRTATRAHAGQYDWLFVWHHKTTIGVADHAADTDIQFYVEAGIEQLFANHNVDVVLAGHDHSYARSFPLQVSRAAGSINGVIFNRANNGNRINKGDGTVFFTLNSSTGQKFYAEFVPAVKDNTDFPYLADGTRGSAELMSGKLHWGINVFHQKNRPMFMGVDVDSNSITLRAFEVQSNGRATVVDTFTIIRPAL